MRIKLFAGIGTKRSRTNWLEFAKTDISSNNVIDIDSNEISDNLYSALREAIDNIEFMFGQPELRWPSANSKLMQITWLSLFCSVEMKWVQIVHCRVRLILLVLLLLR